MPNNYEKRAIDVNTGERTKEKASIRVSDLVKVTAFDQEKMTVDVQPLADIEIDATYETQPQYVNIPVGMIQMGRWVVRPWYEVDDLGVIIYNDSDTDNAMAGGGEGEPNTRRNHAPEDSKFYGGIKADNIALPGNIPAPSFAIFSKDGSVFWTMQDDRMQSQGDIYHEGDIYITGDVMQIGDYKQTGTHTVTSGDVIADGISLKHHTYTGDSGGTTSEPIGGGG